ncbi:MAG: hypothetical protein U1E65_07120 [Myxococcota bacterium]
MDGLLRSLDLLTFQPGDLLVVGVLIVLEGLLSCDNAVVLALVVKDLPPSLRSKALRYGIVGAYVSRILALALATSVMRIWWIKTLGGLYLLRLAVVFFLRRGESHGEPQARPVRRFLGLSVFWSTVVAVELTDMIFSVDSIAAAVAMSSKLWVLIAGGLLGILAMRFAAQGFVHLLARFPRLEPAAFAAVGLIGLKLLLEIPVDVLGREVPLTEGVRYTTPKDYAAAVEREIQPLVEVPHLVRINQVAPPAPDPRYLLVGAKAVVERENPGLTGAALEAAVDEELKLLHREAESIWNLEYRPLLHIGSFLSSALVLLIFAFGFLPPPKAKA